MTVLSGVGIVTSASTFERGWVRVEGGLIVEVGTGSPPGGTADDLNGAWLVPGYVDIHCHGGRGQDFASGTAAQLREAAAHHLRHGSTGLLASLVTAPVADLCRQLAVIADVVEAGDSTILGSHLEGPFLSRVRCGAQNPAWLIEPDTMAFAEMVVAARGTLKMITVAPELPGALELITTARAAGIAVAIGHTDASYEQTLAAFEAGASIATHLFNGMRPINHREPGPVMAAMEFGADCEIINDGVHVHPAVAHVIAQRDPRRLVLITDAISACGIGDGTFTLGGQEVRVEACEARLATTNSLAGSLLTLDDAVRRTVFDSGLSVPQAVAAASGNPARALGLNGARGSIQPGLVADFVLLDEALSPLRVMRQGVWVS